MRHDDPSDQRARNEAQGIEVFEETLPDATRRMVEAEEAQGSEIFTDPDSYASVDVIAEGAAGSESFTASVFGIDEDEDHDRGD